MSELSDYTASLTPEQQEHVAQLRRKFFRWVSIISVIGTILFMFVLRYTVYNYKSPDDYAQYITHKDKFMRFNAAKALGQFENDNKAVILLTQMLNDTSKEVKWHACASLARLRSNKAIPALKHFVEREKDVSAKSVGIYALGQIKDNNITPFLLEEFEKSIIKKDEKTIKDERIIQFSIIQSLAFINSSESIKGLEEIKNRENIDKEAKDFISNMIKSHGLDLNKK
ncbi:MAG: HEAT repeat domain-containing protein [Candidatus Sericytochromatia bacterium]